MAAAAAAATAVAVVAVAAAAAASEAVPPPPAIEHPREPSWKGCPCVQECSSSRRKDRPRTTQECSRRGGRGSRHWRAGRRLRGAHGGVRSAARVGRRAAPPTRLAPLAATAPCGSCRSTWRTRTPHGHWAPAAVASWPRRCGGAVAGTRPSRSCCARRPRSSSRATPSLTGLCRRPPSSGGCWRRGQAAAATRAARPPRQQVGGPATKECDAPVRGQWGAAQPVVGSGPSFPTPRRRRRRQQLVTMAARAVMAARARRRLVAPRRGRRHHGPLPDQQLLDRRPAAKRRRRRRRRRRQLPLPARASRCWATRHTP